jgi:hypothetical protein
MSYGGRAQSPSPSPATEVPAEQTSPDSTAETKDEAGGGTAAAGVLTVSMTPVIDVGQTCEVTWGAFAGAKEYLVAAGASEDCSGSVAVQRTKGSIVRLGANVADGSVRVCVLALNEGGKEIARGIAKDRCLIDRTPARAFELTGPSAWTSRAAPVVTWTAATGAEHYEVGLGTTTECDEWELGPFTTGETTMELAGLAGGEHIACVFALDGHGNSRLAEGGGRRFVSTLGFALGQPDTTSSGANSGGVSAASLSAPAGAWTDGKRLVVADSANNRVLIWNDMPVASGEPADVVLGQPDMTSTTANNGGISAATLNGPLAVHVDGARLFVADYLNNRVLIWAGFPTQNMEPADVVVGQPNATSNGNLLTQSGLQRPSGIATAAGRLYIADGANNRILIYAVIPTTDGAPATLVLGQSDFTHGADNAGGLDASAISDPSAVYADSDHLVVADSGNDRVLIWSPPPTTNGAPATVVLGQPTANVNGPNNGGLGAATMSYPVAAGFAAGRLYVAERGNNRVLIWNEVPAATGAPADRVFGQAALDAGADNAGGLGARSLSSPQGLFVGAGLLLVPEVGNDRVLAVPLDALEEE